VFFPFLVYLATISFTETTVFHGCIINSELEKKWKENSEVFKVVFWHPPGENE
jgi:hypothetical protein